VATRRASRRAAWSLPVISVSPQWST